MKRTLIILTIISSLTWVGIIIYKQSLPYHEVGKVHVNSFPNTYFEIRQENEFDNATALEYKFVYNNNDYTGQKFLMGTHDYLSDPKVFKSNSVDSIIYITWDDTIQVCAVYNLKTHYKFPNRGSDYKSDSKIHSQIFDELKTKKPYLKRIGEK